MIQQPDGDRTGGGEARPDAHGPAGEAERLRRLIDAAPFGAHVYELHDDGRLVFLAGNEPANRILGVDCSRFVGLTIEEAFPPLVDTLIPDAYRAVARDGVPYHEEQVVYNAGGISGIYDVYALQLASHQMAAFFQDITERRRAEAERAELEAELQQARKMEAVGALAGGIAHDFNNLLTAIAGYAELLRGSLAPDDPRVDDVDQIRRASGTAAGLIRQLMAFSRQAPVSPSLVDVGECVRNSERILRRVLGEQVTLVARIPSNLDPVFADETHIVQVVLNLAVNARDAMPSGGTLTIDVANAEVDGAFAERHPPLVPGRYVAVTVADTGVGMDETTQQRVFEPFFTTKDPGKGTGLGLATVYGIVKRAGGSIVVESAVGEGSRFTVFLPSTIGERTAPEPGAERAAGGRTGSVLVAEDASDVRSYVTRVLEAQGHRVLVAADGMAALALASAERGAIDVLLTDVVMPGMSGRDLARWASLEIPDLRVVYMSGYATPVLSDDDLAAPDFRLLAKPFSAEELLRAIDEALRDSP